MAKVENCTPHPVTIVRRLANGHTAFVREYPPAETPVRLAVQVEKRGEVDGVPLSRTFFGDPVNLPPQRRGVLLIVSQLVKNACPWRPDLVVPAEVVRDSRGVIVGCESLGL